VAVRVVRLGTKRTPGEGLRLGTVRRPPRGVPKARFAKDDWYDLWLPDLAPSEALVKQGQRARTDADWRAFGKKYRGEMAAPEKARLLALLAALSQASDFAVGCYCEDENRCHRAVLRALLTERGAKLAR
jgi:uncharacterized protein YeaO (DUF488 family)